MLAISNTSKKLLYNPTSNKVVRCGAIMPVCCTVTTSGAGGGDATFDYADARAAGHCLIYLDWYGIVNFGDDPSDWVYLGRWQLEFDFSILHSPAMITGCGIFEWAQTPDASGYPPWQTTGQISNLVRTWTPSGGSPIPIPDPQDLSAARLDAILYFHYLTDGTWQIVLQEQSLLHEDPFDSSSPFVGGFSGVIPEDGSWDHIAGSVLGLAASVNTSYYSTFTSGTGLPGYVAVGMHVDATVSMSVIDNEASPCGAAAAAFGGFGYGYGL